MNFMFKLIAIIIIIMTSSLTYASSFDSRMHPNITICSTDEAMASLIQLKRLPINPETLAAINKYYTTKTCERIDSAGLQFKLIRYNQYIAEVAFYDENNQLLTNQNVWVETVNINKETFSTSASSIADRLKQTRTKNTPPAQQKNLNLDKDMDAFLKQAIANAPAHENENYEGD